MVREHIERAEAVSSLALLRRYDVGVSSATVRAELAALTDLGFLRQPHASAGREPTVEGYRYFVEHLMRTGGLTPAEKATIERQFSRAGRDPERWMRLSAAVMAQCSGAAALVATTRRQPAPLRRLELVAVDTDMVQVVAVMDDGTVRQWRWRPEYEVEQDVLDRLGERINEAARSGVGDPPARAEMSPLELAGLELVRELLPDLRQPVEPRLYHAGLAQVLEQPDFAESSGLHTVIELLEYGHGLDRFFEVMAGGRLEVILGGEPPLEGVPQVSFVLAPFGNAQEPAGVMGVIGPRRLAYERAVPAVRFVSGIMSRLYAGESV